MKKFLIKAVMAITLVAAMATAAMAQTAEDALATVKRSVTVVLDDLQRNEAKYRKNPAALNQMINSKMLPYFDAESMAKLVLAKHWRKASPAQRNTFISEFKELIMRTYSSSLLDYTNATVAYGKPGKVEGEKRKRTKIDVTITNTDGKVFPLTLSMGYTDGQWKGYDVSMDGLSVITSYRSSIGEQVARKGLQKVIEDIKALNAKGEVLAQ